MTAKPVLNSSVCVSTMLNNVPVVVTGAHMGNVGSSDKAKATNLTPLPGLGRGWGGRPSTICHNPEVKSRFSDRVPEHIDSQLAPLSKARQSIRLLSS